MESFVTARCFQLLKIKNGLFRREALYKEDVPPIINIQSCWSGLGKDCNYLSVLQTVYIEIHLGILIPVT